MNKPTKELRHQYTQKPEDQFVCMYQTWSNLLFVHWEVDPHKIQETLPSGLFVDTFEGKAFVGVVPFFMKNIRPRFLPAVSGISNFLELNVRTYVHDENGIPGVWFYSLDANQPLAVEIARNFFKLPYIHSQMEAKVANGKITYESKWKEKQNCESKFVYERVGDFKLPEHSSLEYFLLERYLLFSYDYKKQKLFTGQVHHKTYEFAETKVDKLETNLLKVHNLETLDENPCHLCIAKDLNVAIYPIKENLWKKNKS